jgi:hypothetical protein
MTIPEDSIILSKIKRIPDTMNFHQILIFNESGICIYKLNTSNLYIIDEEQLISSFFTALMSFTKEMVGTEIKAIEMSNNLKIVVLKKGKLFYIILCNSMENIALISELVSKIDKNFRTYIQKNEIHTDLEFIHDMDLDTSIEEIICNYLSNEFDLIKEKKIISYLKGLNYDDQINGIIFLTDLGHVIYSSLKQSEVRTFLKEVEFRVKICNNNILKLFYTSKDKKLIFSEYILNKYFIILIFDLNIRFGLADFYLQKIVKTIESYFSS